MKTISMELEEYNSDIRKAIENGEQRVYQRSVEEFLLNKMKLVEKCPKGSWGESEKLEVEYLLKASHTKKINERKL